MSEGRMYLRPLETPGGNVGHELVMLVKREAIAKARQDAEDARRRANEARRGAEAVRALREAQAARRKVSKAIFDMAEAWLADMGNRGRGRKGAERDARNP